MLLHDQTLFRSELGKPDSGNCWQCSIACVLGLSLELVPHFCASLDWQAELAEFLLRRRLMHLIIVGFDGTPLPDVLCTVSGKSPRGDFDHCVVGRGGLLIHDPHPSKGFLDCPFSERQYDFYVPLAALDRLFLQFGVE